MAAIERWVNETSRTAVTRTGRPAGDTHSTVRLSVPAWKSSTRSCRSN